MTPIRALAICVVLIAIAVASRAMWVPSASVEREFDRLLEQGHPEAALALLNEALECHPKRRTLHERRILLVLGSASPEAPSSVVSAWRAMHEVAGVRSDILNKALRHPNVKVRYNAARAIELLRLPDARRALERRIQDPDVDVRVAVVAALGTIGRPESFFSLAMALRDNDWRVRAEAASGLGRLGDSRALAHLARTAQDADEYVRFQACEALVKLAQPGSSLFLAKVLQETKGSMAEGGIALALAKAGDPAGYLRLESLFKEQDEDTRRKTAKTLMELDIEVAGKIFRGLIERETDPETKHIMLNSLTNDTTLGRP
jgi:hypothetical protein